ncbi:MAG: GIY-YIG nuclease family protein [Patescibacteria group bacterium]|nr:GIY-YIG nuclease family protein [Patescibacteria group bacterium]MDD5715993.1 GIY-YIG nuclease family protein [Patescibacteria group bacterium]
MYYCYILFSPSSGKTYTGITSDPKRRLVEHNQRRSEYTKRFIPWKIIYLEKCKDRLSARKREIYYKSSAGRKRIATIYSGIV